MKASADKVGMEKILPVAVGVFHSHIIFSALFIRDPSHTQFS